MEETENAFADAIAKAQEELGLPMETPEETEEKPEEVEVPKETPEETAAERDDKGRFVKKEEPVPEPEKEEPTKEEEKPEEKPEEDINPFKLSAEQLEEIEKNPNLSQAYKSMQRGLTQARQREAEELKTFKSDAEQFAWIKENPEKALEILAERAGRKVVPKDEAQEQQEQKDEAFDKIFKKWEEALGDKEAANRFYPLLKESFEAFFQTQIAPIQQQTTEMRQQSEAEQINAGISAFAASKTTAGEEWDQSVNKAMADKMKVLHPAENSSLQDYLSALYDAVMYDRSREGRIRAAHTRLKAAEEKDEPVTSARPVATPEQRSVTVDMSEDDAIALAVKLAQES